jgi:hypothetical protein
MIIRNNGVEIFTFVINPLYLIAGQHSPLEFYILTKPYTALKTISTLKCNIECYVLY